MVVVSLPNPAVVPTSTSIRCRPELPVGGWWGLRGATLLWTRELLRLALLGQMQQPSDIPCGVWQREHTNAGGDTLSLYNGGDVRIGALDKI